MGNEGEASRGVVVHRGFTMVELVVVIGVVMVLLGFLLPALSGARGAAVQISDSVLLREFGLEIDVYTSSQDGKYPYDPESVAASLSRVTEIIQNKSLLFSSSEVATDAGLARSPVSYSMAFCYDWRRMRQGETEYTPLEEDPLVTDFTQLEPRQIRVTDVASPSLKGLAVHSWISYGGVQSYFCCVDQRPRAPVCFADNSVSPYSWPEMLIQTDGLLVIENGIGVPVQSTWNGIKGRDR